MDGIKILIVVALFGIVASMIVMWFSRRREFRADAGGARLAGRESMIRAREDLVQANGTVVNGYNGEAEMLPISEEIVKLASRVHGEITEVSKKKKGKVQA